MVLGGDRAVRDHRNAAWSDDDLALSILPAGQRALVRAMRWSLLRRLMMCGRASGRCAVRGRNIACRKRFIDDKLDEALGRHRCRRRSWARAWTPGDTGSRVERYPGLRGGPAGQHRPQEGRRTARDRCAAARLFTWCHWTLSTTIWSRTLTEHGYRTDAPHVLHLGGRDPVPDRGRGSCHAHRVCGAAPGSRLVFTYVRKDFIDGVNMYGAAIAVRAVPATAAGVALRTAIPTSVGGFIAEYGWRLVEQAGPDYYVKHYIKPARRVIFHASDLEMARTRYAEKVRTARIRSR